MRMRLNRYWQGQKGSLLIHKFHLTSSYFQTILQVSEYTPLCDITTYPYVRLLH